GAFVSAFIIFFTEPSAICPTFFIPTPAIFPPITSAPASKATSTISFFFPAIPPIVFKPSLFVLSMPALRAVAALFLSIA
ncbi:TPA: hypothetical protein ACGFUW_002715, partial [Flavobacterium psychrophilum]